MQKYFNIIFTIVCFTIVFLFGKSCGNSTLEIPKDYITVTKMDANFINGLNQSLFFKGLWDFRLAFYDRVVANNPAKKKYLKGWQNRLNTHKFIA